MIIRCILFINTFLWSFVAEVGADQVYYRMITNEQGDNENEDFFLRKEFFQCNVIDKCTNVVRTKGTKVFKLVHGTDEMMKGSDYDIIYEKMTIRQPGKEFV